MSILHCNSINMTENKEKRNSPPLGWPLWLTDEKRLRYQKCCISLPAVFAQIHYFLLSGIHQPSSCTTKVQRWPDVFLMFWLLTLLGTISCLDWGNTWSLISVKLEKKPSHILLSQPLWVSREFKNCVFIHYVFPLSDFGQWFKAAPHNSPQEEAVELSGAVKHADRGECDGSSRRRIHLLCFEWTDGEKRFSISYSLWWVLWKQNTCYVGWKLSKSSKSNNNSTFTKNMYVVVKHEDSWRLYCVIQSRF